MPVIYPTAYHALTRRTTVKPGEFVLIHAAAGGVGSAAVTIAKHLGAKVIATAGSDDKLRLAKSFGADFLVNYSHADWADKVSEITNGRGVDVVLDMVGG